MSIKIISYFHNKFDVISSINNFSHIEIAEARRFTATPRHIQIFIILTVVEHAAYDKSFIFYHLFLDLVI